MRTFKRTAPQECRQEKLTASGVIENRSRRTASLVENLSLVWLAPACQPRAAVGVKRRCSSWCANGAGDAEAPAPRFRSPGRLFSRPARF
jgi:hypothetical protein